jgi:hypothetical protein
VAIFRKPVTTGIKMNERGIVALISAIVISLLLSVIVISMVGLMIGEARQAQDADQSIRAYYAAEAGIEDALLKVKAAGAGVAEQSSCSGTGMDFGDGSGFTCQLIEVKNNQLAGRLNPEEATQLEPFHSGLGAGVHYNRVVINWHQPGLSADPNVVGNPYLPPTSYTPRGSWTWPAVMEVTMLWFNPASITPISGVNIHTLLVRPSNTAFGTDYGNLLNTTQIDGNCSTDNLTRTGGYNCQAILNLTVGPGAPGPANAANQFIFRIRPRYAGANYRVTFHNGAGPAREVQDQFAVIDVTAKAGDVFRRVQAHVPVTAAAASGLDFVLFSDTDICKDFEVIGGVATPHAPCPGAGL